MEWQLFPEDILFETYTHIATYMAQYLLCEINFIWWMMNDNYSSSLLFEIVQRYLIVRHLSIWKNILPFFVIWHIPYS
jgi:hypothetical protein